MNTLPSTLSPLARFPAMSRWSPLLLLAVVFAACGGDPPKVCGAPIPQQELFVRQTALLQPCFEDPEKEKLTLTAKSSDPEISTVLVLGLAIRIKAVSPGSNTITVTAEDPGGQTASIDIQVLVPNQAPIAKGKMKMIKMLVEGKAVREVDGFFDDPDDQELVFSATSADASVAGAEIMDSIKLLVTGNRLGETVVTVTATDPGGLTAMREVQVQVLEPVQIVSEQFDGNTGGFLPNFATYQTSVDGHLRLTNRYSYYWGWTSKNSVNATEWEYTASVAQEEDMEESIPGLGSYNASGTNPLLYFLFFGEVDSGNPWNVEGNYMMVYWAPGWSSEGSFWGESDAVADVGEHTEVTWTNRGGQMTVMAGSTLLFRVDLAARSWATDMANMMVVTYAGSNTYRYSRVDWVELWGIEDGDLADLAPEGDWHHGPPEFDEIPGVFATKPGVDIPVEILK